jgi:hypothetical protein
MDDLVAHKDRFAEFLQRTLNDIYGADHARAETARLGKNDPHQNEFRISHTIIPTFRQNRAGRNGANSAGKSIASKAASRQPRLCNRFGVCARGKPMKQ